MAEKTTIRINTTYDPPISGYGGYDEWFLEDLPNEAIDELNNRLEKQVQIVKNKYKVPGGWCGST